MNSWQKDTADTGSGIARAISQEIKSKLRAIQIYANEGSWGSFAEIDKLFNDIAELADRGSNNAHWTAFDIGAEGGCRLY